MHPTLGRLCLALCAGLFLVAGPAVGDPALPAAADAGGPAPQTTGDAPTALALAPDPLFEEEPAEDYDGSLGRRVADPLERSNRAMFGFNEGVDRYVLTPVTNAYQFVVPAPVRHSVRRFFVNLNSPVYFVNNLLQLRFRDAAETFGAFALNSTAGFVGLFDPAKEAGWSAHPADFGETLGRFGVNSGPYLVLPLLGPSTVRDGFGDVVDRAFQPLTYLLGMGELLFIGGGNGVVVREANDEALAALRESSVDYYAAMRSAYTQNREARIAELRAGGGSPAEELSPDADGQDAEAGSREAAAASETAASRPVP
jgi:phospholipid-binding lipoprotein MlaA